MSKDQALADYLPKNNDLMNESIANQSEKQVPPLSSWHFIFSPKIPLWKFDDQHIIRFNLSQEIFFPYYLCHILFMLQYYYYYTVLSHYFMNIY